MGEDMTRADAAANEAGRGAPILAFPDLAPGGDESVGEIFATPQEAPEPMTCPECLGTGYLMCPTCEGEGNVDSIESEDNA